MYCDFVINDPEMEMLLKISYHLNQIKKIVESKKIEINSNFIDNLFDQKVDIDLKIGKLVSEFYWQLNQESAKNKLDDKNFTNDIC